MPQDLYSPIRQDAVLLKTGADERGREGVPGVPERPGSARDHREIRLRARISDGCRLVRNRLAAGPPDRRTRLDHDAILLLVSDAARLVARPSRAWWKEAIAAVVSLPHRAAADGARLLPAGRARAARTGRRDRAAVGRPTLAFTFSGLVIGSVVYSLPFVVQPIRNAFAAIGDGPLEVAATLRASPCARLFTVALPLASPGLLTGAMLGFAHTVGEFGVVLMIGGNIPGRTAVLSIAIFDYVENSAMGTGEPPGDGNGRLRLRGHSRDDPDRETFRGSATLSGKGEIHARFRGTIGAFALDARFTAPAAA